MAVRIRKLLWINQDGRCAYCDRFIPSASMGTVDHYIPLCRDGGRATGNLRFACVECNNAKGDFMPKDRRWLRRLLRIKVKATP